MILKLPTSIVSSLVLIILIAASATAQQKRQTPAKTQPHPVATPAPTPPPTFDTLLAADSYRVYGEVRSVGQMIRSTSVNEILEPIMKLAAPPKEFRTLVKWLNTHADDVISSRMLLATWPANREFPDAVIAIEFASPDEAAKFQQKLNPMLKILLPESTLTAEEEANKAKARPAPPYHIQQAGSLILITPTPLNLQKLRPAGSKLLSEDTNFRVARNRFSTESIFIFFDVGSVEREDQERTKKSEEEYKKAAAERAANPPPEEPARVELQTEPEEIDPRLPEERATAGAQTELKAAPASEPPTEQQKSAQEFLMTLSMVMGSLPNVEAKWPEALGVGISLEGESFDARALMVTAPGQKSDPIPFFPVLAPGPLITPDAPNILPADTEMLVSMSLDLPQIYAGFSTPRPMLSKRGPDMRVEEVGQIEPPFAALERQLKIKIKDDLLPLIGSEIAVSVPITGIDWFQPPKAAPQASSKASPPSPQPSPGAIAGETFTITETTRNPLNENGSIAIAISLRDKDGMRAFLPKLIESVGFKGANALAQTERREDTELVSYANMVSYAFIGNFVVISPDVATTRRIVDSYLKRQTLSGDPHFKNYTRWQPRQVQAQIYISPILMESYRTWIQQPTTPVDEQTRALLTRFSVMAQPITYSLSNEGFGPLHELHIPKNLVLLIIAASVGGINTPADTPEPSSSPVKPPVTPANPF